ncbi:DedA family protein [Xylanimonas ulmi]|uniref:Membrane protein DedA with SNARE-associated domain n=1 Tax=Xylanimonas ulmi TaxID=228973 RepID=A0A4Q7MAB9_9MICO|nr:DedA family protein [Xylanibacterium ulmi]RZS63179.1 membrane protein DedA with SNARE-associated domain [Xylanibacterium ulmi]
MTILSQVEDWILATSGAGWVYPLMFALALIDGFFPPLPSESVIITLAVASVATGSPWLVGVLVAAVLGAWCGDQIAYQIGRSIGTERIAILRTRRGRSTVAWARLALARRGAAFIIAARYVPIGRVAVNMTAGAVGYSRRRFLGYSGIAAVVWGVYSVAVGLTAGAWLQHNPLLAMAVGIVAGVLVGVLLDRVVRAVLRRRGEAVDEMVGEMVEGSDDQPAAVTACAAAPAGASGRRPW